jgi:hypothetical protein
MGVQFMALLDAGVTLKIGGDIDNDQSFNLGFVHLPDSELSPAVLALRTSLASASPISPLKATIRLNGDRERQRADALARLEHLDGLSRAPEWGDGIRSKLRTRLTEWHGFPARQPEVARQIYASCSWVGSCSRLTKTLEPTRCKVARAMAVCWRESSE